MDRRAEVVLPALYVALAIYVWFDFVTINRDGLANVGLFLVTLPVTILVMLGGWLLGYEAMPMPSGHGYLGDHALYYLPAVAVTAALCWMVGRLIDRILAK